MTYDLQQFGVIFFLKSYIQGGCVSQNNNHLTKPKSSIVFQYHIVLVRNRVI